MMNFKFKFSKSVTPSSSFVERITIENDSVVVKMKNRPTLYHYPATKEIVNAIKCIDDKMTAGKVYNKYLRGKSVAKTVFF